MLTSLSALRMFVMLCILSCVSCWHVPRRTFSSFCAFSAASVLKECAVESCLTCPHNSISACDDFTPCVAGNFSLVPNLVPNRRPKVSEQCKVPGPLLEPELILCCSAEPLCWSVRMSVQLARLQAQPLVQPVLPQILR